MEKKYTGLTQNFATFNMCFQLRITTCESSVITARVTTRFGASTATGLSPTSLIYFKSHFVPLHLREDHLAVADVIMPELICSVRFMIYDTTYLLPVNLFTRGMLPTGVYFVPHLPSLLLPLSPDFETCCPCIKLRISMCLQKSVMLQR